MTTETKKLGNYTLDILPIEEFKSYYYDNLGKFYGQAENAFLKTVDIPAKFYKEQPEETQEELIDNRDTFVRETKKYFDKVIIVLKNSDNEILNACRMAKKEAALLYDKLKQIDEISNKYEQRSFIKDGYISFVISKEEELNKEGENQVLVLDFPIMMNKKPVIHKAFMQLSSPDAEVEVDHIKYITSEEILLVDNKRTGACAQFDNIKEAVVEFSDFLVEDVVAEEEEELLRENEVISMALVENGTIPKSYVQKVGDYLNDNTEGTSLTTKKLENLVLDFDENLRTYKQVSNLRSVSGKDIKDILNSEAFKELELALEKEE